MNLAFRVRGIPVPQGSSRAFIAGGRAVVATEGNRLSSPLGAWRAAIRNEASTAMAGHPVYPGAVSVKADFAMPRPRSLAKRVTVPDVKPDLDKLVRALLDALTGVVVRDDAQVVVLEVGKHYDSGHPGVWVLVSELPGGRA